MSSSRSPSSSLWDLPSTAKGTNNNRSNDRQAEPRQERRNIRRQTTVSKKRTAYNESNRFEEDNKNRYPFSSLLSSRDNHNTNQSRLDRGDYIAELGGNKTSSVAASFPEEEVLQHSTIDEMTSIKNIDSSDSSATTQPKSDQPAVFSDVGSDLLEFGASVEFHEDHRRHIHAETLEIESSSEITREAVSKENRAEEQLTKDLGRSKMELHSLNQGAGDQFESAKMFWTLTTNLRQELLSRIVEPTKTVATSGSPTTTSKQNLLPSTSHPVTPDGRKQGISNRENEFSNSSNNDKNKSHPLSNQDILAQQASRAEKMLQALKAGTISLKAIKVEIESLHEKQDQLEASMQSQNLEESVNRSKEDECRIHSEILQDRDVKATRIIEIQQLRESCRKKAQTCMGLEKVLAEAKNNNAIEEAKLRHQYQNIQVDVDSLLKGKEEMMLKLELEKRKLEQASNVMDDYHNYCKVRENYKREKALRNEEKKELLARQAEAMRKLKKAQDEEEASLLRKQQAQKTMSLAETRKAENSEIEAIMVLHGKAELADLSDRKMKLAQQIAEASKKAEKGQAKERETMAEKFRAKSEAIAQTEKLQAEYKAKQEEIETTENENNEFVQLHSEEIDSNISKAAKFAELRKAKREAYERRLEVGKEQLSKKLLCRVEEQERIFESNTFKLDVMERGIVLLRDAEKVEREAQHAK